MTNGHPTRVAAFFDLDKTVIAGSSALAFTRQFYSEGLLDRRTLIKSAYTQLALLLPSDDEDQVQRLRRHVTRMCKDWDVSQINRIVAETLDEVVTPLVYEAAAELILTHHQLGHDVVLVSASGSELVGPIGAMLGVDHVRATQMRVVDGHYTGELESYCYGEQKAVAIRELAAEHDYDLAQSYAFSDSVTDVPMLLAVGHPVAVNPDRQLRKYATTAGWPIMQFHRAVPPRRHLPDPSPRMAAAVAVGVGAAAAGCGVGIHLMRSRQH